MKIGIKFRLLNWLTRDYLRNYLTVGVNIPIDNAIKWCNSHPEAAIHELQKAKRTIGDILRW